MGCESLKHTGEELFLQGTVCAPSNLGEGSGIDKENPGEEVELKGKEGPKHPQDLRKTELQPWVGEGGPEGEEGEVMGTPGHNRSARRDPKLGGPTGALTSTG